MREITLNSQANQLKEQKRPPAQVDLQAAWNAFKLRFVMLIEKTEKYERMPSIATLKARNLYESMLLFGGYSEVIERLKKEGELDHRFDPKLRSLNKKIGGPVSRQIKTNRAKRLAEKKMGEPKEEKIMKNEPKEEIARRFRTADDCQNAMRRLSNYERPIYQLKELEAIVDSAEEQEVLKPEHEARVKLAKKILKFSREYPHAWEKIINGIKLSDANLERMRQKKRAVLETKEAVKNLFKNILGDKELREYERKENEWGNP